MSDFNISWKKGENDMSVARAIESVGESGAPEGYVVDLATEVALLRAAIIAKNAENNAEMNAPVLDPNNVMFEYSDQMVGPGDSGRP